MPKIFKAISHHFKLPKTVHIVGTNGKGSTGRYLTKMIENAGLSVGHYTSPHILEFNERIYKNGGVVGYDELERLHLKLLDILGESAKELSYFEYATLLAFLAFEDCDFMVLEAGVGGEYDATNVAPKLLSVITPISLDHQDLLGATIQEIAATKLSSVNNPAIIAPQEYGEVLEAARGREADCGFSFTYVDKDEKNEGVEKYAKRFALASFLKQNLLVAMRAASFLGINTNLDTMHALDLRARCEKAAPNVTLDAGHNADAAQALRKHFDGKKVVLIYNSYKDKDFKSILRILKPIIKYVELIDIINTLRPNAKYEIKEYLRSLGIKCEEYKTIDKAEEYLVFGSFSVVESFLKSFA
jgi:dihydrofolate synthase/folylpolyglutamate synthase